eukprot:1041527-Amphidinium_carterae.1
MLTPFALEFCSLDAQRHALLFEARALGRLEEGRHVSLCGLKQKGTMETNTSMHMPSISMRLAMALGQLLQLAVTGENLSALLLACGCGAFTLHSHGFKVLEKLANVHELEVSSFLRWTYANLSPLPKPGWNGSF